MKIILNLLLTATVLLSFSFTSFGQLSEIDQYAGRKYKKVYKKIVNDSNFVSCRVLNAKPSQVTGVELFFKNDVHYSITFERSKLDDGYTCTSPEIRRMRVYAIHYYIGDTYQEGYYKRKDEKEPHLIKPDIQKVDEPESIKY